MKLTKDQTQKIMLGGMLLVGVIYGFIEFLIGPAQASAKRFDTNAAELEPKIKAARDQIKKTNDLGDKIPAAAQFTAQVNALIPEGAPVAWFPPRVTDYFKRHRVERGTVRQNSEAVEKDLAGFRRLAWGLDFAKIEFAPFATALADLENEEPLLEIQGIDIEVNRDELQFQHASLIVNSLVRQ